MSIALSIDRHERARMIRRAREEAGYETTSEVAALLGIPRQSYEQLENEAKGANPTTERLCELANIGFDARLIAPDLFRPRGKSRPSKVGETAG